MKFSKIIHPENFNPTKRFSKRVFDYIKYRPSYPVKIFEEILIPELNINENSIAADLGSGTGIFSKLMLDNTKVKKLFCVEPNKEMREAAESLLANEYKERYCSINGTGEASSLDNNICDLVTCAQAFHWFNIKEAKQELKKILKPDGNLLLVWNFRNDETPFLKSFDNLLRKYSKDYESVHLSSVDKTDMDFIFSQYSQKTISNKQLYHLEDFIGRTRSSSWCPDEKSSEYEPLMKDMTSLFNQYQVHGFIDFIYQTKCYYGKI